MSNTPRRRDRIIVGLLLSIAGLMLIIFGRVLVPIAYSRMSPTPDQGSAIGLVMGLFFTVVGALTIWKNR